ncbi:MAG: helix-turn-helix domain-containing protein [Desulfobacteraceae bacterium]
MEDDKTFQKLRENERETRKNLILDAALNVFEKKTFYKTSMSDIAKELGVSTATLYSYFPSQEELFLEAFIRDLSYIDKILKESFDNSSNKEDSSTAIDMLANAMVSHLLNSEATFQLISLLMTERDMPEHLKEKFYMMKQELNERMLNVLKLSGIKDPDIKTSRAFFASVIGAIMLFKNFPEKEMKDAEENLIDLVSYIVTLFKAGVQAMS